MVIPDAIRRELEQHADDEAPNEACGLIVFSDGEAVRYERGRNAADSPYRRFADEAGLRPLIRLGTEVVEARFDDAEQVWSVTTRTAGGPEETDTYQVVISAVGQLNRPKYPDLPGIADFAGPSILVTHSRGDVRRLAAQVLVIERGAVAQYGTTDEVLGSPGTPFVRRLADGDFG